MGTQTLLLLPEENNVDTERHFHLTNWRNLKEHSPEHITLMFSQGRSIEKKNIFCRFSNVEN